MLFALAGFVGGVAVGVFAKDQILKLVEVTKGLVSKLKKK